MLLTLCYVIGLYRKVTLFLVAALPARRSARAAPSKMVRSGRRQGKTSFGFLAASFTRKAISLRQAVRKDLILNGSRGSGPCPSSPLFRQGPGEICMFGMSDDEDEDDGSRASEEDLPQAESKTLTTTFVLNYNLFVGSLLHVLSRKPFAARHAR